MKNLIFSLLLLLPLSFFAQNEAKLEARLLAKNQITEMKSGILLVRLYNKKNTIEALENQGMEKRANAVREKQKKINKEIIASFQNFTFCEVYFFYSDHSPFLLSGEYHKVELFSDFETKNQTKLVNSNYFVADFGVLKNEDSKNSDKSGETKTGRTKVKQYKGGRQNTSKRCMFLRDNKLTQLQRPFPFTVWFHPTPIQNLSYQQVVEKMNKQLYEFYNKNK